MFRMTEEITIFRLCWDQKGSAASDACCRYSSPEKPKLRGDLRRDGHELSRMGTEIRVRLETPMLMVGL
jgi:hypothetical protein